MQAGCLTNDHLMTCLRDVQFMALAENRPLLDPSSHGNCKRMAPFITYL
ncbi:C2H2-type domain-containing protein [Psidium guajava]|nr:C2H2-type domain-containing protein [Psidium guajava]